MSLGFKRVMSSIMAFVMMVSTLVMVNVASVSAADEVSWSMTDYTQWKDSSGTTLTSNSVSNSEDYSTSVTYGGETYTLYYFGSSSGELNENGSATHNGLKMGGTGNRTRRYFHVNVPAGATINVSAEADGSSSSDVMTYWWDSAESSDYSNKITLKDDTATNTSSPTTYSVTNDGSVSRTLYFTFEGKKQTITAVTLSLGTPAETVTYTATGSITGLEAGKTFILTNGSVNYTATVTETGFIVSSATALTAGEYTVQADGYVNTTVTLTAGTEENTFTFGTIIFEAAPTATITVTNSTSTTLKDVYYWLNTNSGTARQTAADGVISNIDTSTISTIYVTAKGYKGQAVAVSTGSSTIQLEALPTTAISTGASSITPDIIKTALGIEEVIASYQNPIITDADINRFKLSGEFLVQLGIDNSNKPASARIQTSKDSTIKFTPSSNGTLTINGASSSDKNEAKGRGFTIVGEGLNETVDYNASTSAVDKTFKLTAGTEYTITVVNGAINLYSISFVADASDTTTTTESTTESTTEATTTTATTTTEEPDTEESTEAPVSGDYVAVPSEHNLNTAYFVSDDNISAAKGEGITLNNIFFKIKEVRTDDVRITNSNEVKFKVESAATVEIVFDNNDLAISDGTNTATCDRDGKTTIIVNLYPNVEYVISGASSDNTELISLNFTPGNEGTDIADLGSSETTSEGNTETTTENQPEEPESNVNISVSMTGNTGDVKVTINGTSYTFTADETKTISVPEGEKVQFEFDNDVARYITGWTGINPDSYDSNTQAYFTTTDAAAEGVSISLTYDPNAPTSSINEGFMTVTPDTENVLQYGNYGYGQTKGTGIGAVKAEGVAQLNSVSGVVTLYDYMGGYGLTDERLILNDAASVTFKTEGPGYLILDCSLGTPYVTIDGAEAKPTAIGTEGKQGYEIKAADMAVKITKPEGANRSLQLKSVRYQNDGNVITVIEAADADYTTVVNSLPEEMQAEFGEVPEGKVFAKVVAELDQATADAETVDAIGVLIIDKATADAEITNENGSKVFIPRNYINDSDDSNNIIVLTESEALYDGIYDESTPAVDGEYILDEVNTEYGDGIYYMLRYIAVAQGDYYVLPYTVTGGDPAFDEGQFTNVADLEKYKINFGGVQ